MEGRAQVDGDDRVPLVGRKVLDRRDVERLIAPFRHAVLGHQRLDHLVDRAADRRDIAADDQPYLVLLDRKDLAKSPQRLGIVASQ